MPTVRSLLAALCGTLFVSVPALADSARSRPAPARPPAAEAPAPSAGSEIGRPGSLRATPPHRPGVHRGAGVYWGDAGFGVGFAVPIGTPQRPPVDPRKIRVGHPTLSPEPRPIVIVVDGDRDEEASGPPALPPPPPAPPPREGSGNVWLAVVPADASVRLDDLPLGSAADLSATPIHLASGVHVLEVRDASGRAEVLVFSVDPDQEMLVEVDLGATDPRDRARWIDRPPASRRGDG